MHKISIALAFITGMLFSGCGVFSQSATTLDNSKFYNSQSASSAKGTVFIESVNDKRDFQDKPKQASTPSIYKKQVASVSAAEKNTYIGRQRNSYGYGAANIVLDKNQTVTGLIKNRVSKAFAANGFYVISERSNIKQDTLLVYVDINKFWEFVRMGFWKGALCAQINTNITVQNKSIMTDINYEEEMMAVYEEDHPKVLNQALQEYEKDLTAKIALQFK